uniref:Uncharacterized protein n=1 Tax=Brassica oleracea var. oleracea TaxID=109376 RepID=A0A0D3EAC6_BRAOL
MFTSQALFYSPPFHKTSSPNLDNAGNKSSHALFDASKERYHSLTNIQANNLLGTHDLNTRLRAGNSSVNLYFRHKFKLNLLVIRHEFAVDSLIVKTRVYKNSPLARHEFTETLLILGTSSQ